MAQNSVNSDITLFAIVAGLFVLLCVLVQKQKLDAKTNTSVKLGPLTTPGFRGMTITDKSTDEWQGPIDIRQGPVKPSGWRLY
jgi:hypothetical protein